MRPGNFHIIFIFSLLLLVGCYEKDKPLSPETRSVNDPENNSLKKQNDDLIPGQHPQIESRFQLNPDNNQNKIYTSKPETDNDFLYYFPVEPLEKPSLIPADSILKQNKDSRASINRNSINPQERFIFKDGRISPEIFFDAIFDNDIWDYTDYYFTSGISLEFYHPAISASPLTQLLPGLRNSVNYYGLTLVQNLYTPRKLENVNVLAGDRPFAAYLIIGHQRISLSPDKHRRLQSEISIGIIGPASLGGVAQDLIHENKPVGWANQIKNDIVLNYSIRFDQGFYSGKGVELAVIAGGQAGTLYDNIMAGLYLQLGKANNRYGSVFQTTGHQKPFKKRVRYYFSMDVKNKLIMYDATLQGGMFNRGSVYKLEGSQVNRYVFTGTACFGLGLGRYSLEAEQVFLSPEFDGGRHHFWFRIKNIFYIN